MAFNQVNALEFNQIKAQIKNYLKSQSQFSDYDFEGSSMTVLLDVLAYNTYYTAVNANLTVNEGFLETAVLRENVVKLARMLGYTLVLRVLLLFLSILLSKLRFHIQKLLQS